MPKRPTLFEIQLDHEFYCYLKAHLPPGYSIVADPRASYYSEWDFTYKLFHEDRAVEEYSGNFREVARGSLVSEARRLLDSLWEKGDADRQQVTA